MSETAQHQTENDDSALGAVNALATLELAGLSYIQLKRLQKVLRQAGQDVDSEIERRAELDNSGDTVKVPSPNL
jgi:hypothetical protein